MLLLFVALGVTYLLTKRHVLAKSTVKDTSVGLSEAGKRIMDLYMSLPVESRPNIGLRSTLKSLDEKFEKNNVNVHFTKVTHSYMGDKSEEFNWHHHGQVEFGCPNNYGRDCQYDTYITLYNEINGIKKAVDQRNRVMRQVEFDQRGLHPEDIQMITERLRAERDLIKEVTKEIQ